MVRRGLRAALAAAVAAPLLIGPVGAHATSAPLSCGEQTGLWQRVPVRFPAVPSVSTLSDPTTYAVDQAQPQRVLVTNGTVVLVDDRHGCDLEAGLVLGAQPTASVPLSGTTAAVVATAFLPRGRALALVREGSGAASRPRLLASPDGDSGTWQLSEAGLPAQGNPRLLMAAGDGRTAYVVLTPATDSGAGGGPLGALPGAPGAPPAAGLLYATTDGGANWSLRTPVTALPSGVTGFDALAVDAQDPDLVYALSGGQLVVSRDGGRTLTVADGVTDATAVTAMRPGEVAVLRSGQLLHSTDGGTSFNGSPGPASPSSAGYREGDDFLVVESAGRLVRVDARGGRRGVTGTDAGVPSLPRSALGDRAPDGSFHALASGFLLRYVDPRPPTAPPPPPPVGDVPPPPPPPGKILPARQAVSLPVGTSRIVPLELRLQRSPTPTDVYLLLDISSSMHEEIAQLKRDFSTFVSGIQDEGISLQVGLATVGSGKKAGEAPYSDRPTDPDYRKPLIYDQLRAIGAVDQQLARTVSQMRLQTCPPNECGGSQEGHLLALQEMLRGRGIESERSTSVLRDYLVQPGQAAGFRDTRDVRKVAVLASDDAFETPYPTPTGPDGGVAPGYVEQVATDLRTYGISFIGVAATSVGGGSAAAPDMRRLADLVGTRAPAGGVTCGELAEPVPAGAPLVCDGASEIGPVLSRLIQSLADRQSATLSTRGATEVIGSLDASRLRDLDVTVPTASPLLVRVSCLDVPAGTRTAQVDANLRGFRIATATLDVTCTAPVPAAVTPPRADPPPAQDPAPPAQPAQAPAVPAPAPPVVQGQAQAQVQSQVQAQVQPLTAAVLQQQEELQLALALLADDKSAPSTEMAMVDRRRSEELRALALLSLSMGAASALGLARLRTRSSGAVRVHRAR